MIAIALGAGLVALYTYAGYPIVVAFLARLFPFRPVGPSSTCRPFEPTVSVLLPVYNGEALLPAKIRCLRELDYPATKVELLIFSDGSTDSTELLASTLAADDAGIRVLASRERVGKPTALNRLLTIAANDVLFLCDVRQSVDAGALRALVAPLADPSVGCVSGSLALDGETGAGMYWRYERLIRASEGRLGRMVGVSGSIYALRRADMPELPSDILLDDMFVPLRLALATGKRVVLAPTAIARDTAYEDGREFPRKVRTLAGNYQLFARMPRLLVPIANPLWLELTSHKLLRLVCPWALLALFFSSGCLVLKREPTFSLAQATFWRLLFSAQVAFYLLAALGSRARAFGGLARTFVVLNVAAVVGLWRFLRGSQAVTW